MSVHEKPAQKIIVQATLDDPVRDTMKMILELLVFMFASVVVSKCLGLVQLAIA